MQIKITLQSQLIPVRITIIKWTKITSDGKDIEKRRTPMYSWEKCKLVQTLWRVV
jgi:hypothetical protein